jgi:hypothetical protein
VVVRSSRLILIGYWDGEETDHSWPSPLLGDTLSAQDGHVLGEDGARVGVGGLGSVRVPAGAVVYGSSRSWA